jgi:poly(3-hydroxybutyrate) depolymerase
MRYPWVAAASAALLVLASCDARPGQTGSTVPIGQSSRALTVDGRHRTVHLYRPATLDCPAPAPVSVIHIHGTADTRIPYTGGTGEGVAHIDGPAVPDLVATWRATDRCGTPTVTVAGPVTTSTASCDGGRAVELVTIEGAGHQWPGSTGHPVVDRLLGIDEPSTAVSATGTIWRFFAAHPRPGG